jgi:molybdopterin synthase sulfur carrier subunit
LSARIRVHPLLRDLADGQDIVDVKGENLRECLADLDRQFPGMRENIFDKRGKLLKHVEIFINGKTASPNELAAPVKDGDELSILMLLAGG